MRYPHSPLTAVLGLGLALSLLIACPSQPVANAPTDPQASVTPAASAQPGGGTSPTPQPDSGSSKPAPGASATPLPGNGSDFTLPESLSSIRFASVDRFLNQKGESTRIQVELVDSLGNLIPVEVPFTWTSSHPQELSVDAEGNVTALVEFGYSTIEVKIPGTQFEARTVVNVNSVNSGGGGGGGRSTGSGGVSSPVNAAPVIQSLQTSQDTVMGVGTLVKLTASATDVDSTLTPFSYTWSCADPACANQFDTSTGTTVYWRSPAIAGAYALKLTVSDGQLSATQSVKVTVQTGQGQLQVNPQG